MQLDRRVILRAGSALGALVFAPLAARAAERQGEAGRPSRARADATTLGLEPDTGRDVTKALQHAIDQAASRRVTLALAPGRYIASGVTLRPGTHIEGAGPSTILQHLGGPSLLTATAADRVTLRDLAITGGFALDASRRAIVELSHVATVEIDNIHVDLSPASAIALERCGGRVTRCRITGAAKAGIFSLDAEGGVEITHNTLDRIGNNAIQVWRSARGPDQSTVAFNRISNVSARDGGTGQNGNGIGLFRADGVLVASNTITRCAFTAVRANSASNVQIASNAVSGMGEVAIFVEFNYEGAIVTANRIDGAATGICVTNLDHGGRLAVIQGNLVRNIFERPVDPTISGYGIAAEADTTITGNTIESAASAGLRLGWGPYGRDIAATGNVIRRCGAGIVVTSDPAARGILVSSNVISEMANGAIRRMDHGKLLGPDLASAQPVSGGLTIHGNVSR